MRKIPGNNYDFFLIHDEADPPCKRAQMEHLIRETLNSVQLAPKLKSCPSLVNDAVAFLAKGKSENMPNGSQGHYFAIHLACLKNSLEFDAEYLQKRSSLNPKAYQSTVQFLLQSVDPSTIISPEIISKYYGSPDKLREMIEEIQGVGKDFSPLAALAAAYQITQLSGLKTCGTIGAMALLWAHPADLLKESCTAIKKFCNIEKIKEAGKAINEEIRQSRVLKQEDVGLGQKRSSSPRLAAANGKKSSSDRAAVSSSDAPLACHPLLLFNCSCDGPAFGPIIF